MFRRVLAMGALGIAAVVGVSSFALDSSAATASPAWSASGNGFRVTIASLPPERKPSIVLGSTRLFTFVVTVRNLGHRTSFYVTPVIAVDHCACSASPIGLAPLGELWEFDPANAAAGWRDVAYDRIGGGMDFVTIVQQKPFALRPGQVRSFTFRLRFLGQRAQIITFHSGPTAIGAFLMREPVNPQVSLRPLVSAEMPVQLIVR